MEPTNTVNVFIFMMSCPFSPDALAHLRTTFNITHLVYSVGNVPLDPYLHIYGTHDNVLHFMKYLRYAVAAEYLYRIRFVYDDAGVDDYIAQRRRDIEQRFGLYTEDRTYAPSDTVASASVVMIRGWTVLASVPSFMNMLEHIWPDYRHQRTTTPPNVTRRPHVGATRLRLSEVKTSSPPPPPPSKEPVPAPETEPIHDIDPVAFWLGTGKRRRSS